MFTFSLKNQVPQDGQLKVVFPPEVQVSPATYTYIPTVDIGMSAIATVTLSNEV
jgi:hypothetical protein